MPNPHPDLQGWADPSDPQWREKAVARVKARQRKSAVVRQSHRRGQLQLFFDPPFLQLLDAAAFMRGMSIGSYARRAVAKQIAKDLGIDWTHVLKHCAKPYPYGSRPPGRTPNGQRTVDTGEGHGDWTN